METIITKEKERQEVKRLNRSLEEKYSSSKKAGNEFNWTSKEIGFKENEGLEMEIEKKSFKKQTQKMGKSNKEDQHSSKVPTIARKTLF